MAETFQLQSDTLPIIYKIIGDAETALLRLTGYRVDLTMTVKKQEFLTGDVASRAILQRLVCDQFNVTWDELTGPRRHKEISDARHVYMFLSRDVLKRSLVKVGKELNRDHTTIIHGVTTIKNLLAVSDPIEVKVTNIKNKLDEHIDKS